MENNSKQRLTIVQVISNRPSTFPLPPKNQGGTEKVVYELTEELVRRGHRVLLFAAKGSRTRAKLITYPKDIKERSIRSFVEQRLPDDTDIIHDHTFTSALGRRKLRIPTVCTFHLPVKRRVQNPVYVSKRARKVIGNNRGSYVYNGINPDEYEFSAKKDDYLLFIGRILRQKGILHAIRIAEKTKKKLIIAGPIKDQALFRNEIEPRIGKNSNIRYVGAVGGKKKQNLLKHASCLLFPTIWEEPFGLVMIEAMACGTPVVALKNGSVPEVLKGFPNLICSTVEEMIRKVIRGRFPAPKELRQYVLTRFTTKKMVDGYLQIYETIRNQR